MDVVPELPVMSSKVITERLIRHSYRERISITDVENEIVKHARYCWTSYAFRLEQRKLEGTTGHWEEEVVDLMVRSRLRAVLRKWLGKGRSADYKERFLQQHELESVKNKVKDQAVLSTASDAGFENGLTWCGGRETIGNLRAGSSTNCQKGMKRFS